MARLSPAELMEAKEQLRALRAARRSGAKRVIFGERDVTYKSDDEMRRVEKELEEEIGENEMPRRRRSRMFLTTFRDGY